LLGLQYAEQALLEQDLFFVTKDFASDSRRAANSRIRSPTELELLPNDYGSFTPPRQTRHGQDCFVVSGVAV